MIHGLNQTELSAIVLMLRANLREYESVTVSCKSCDNFEKGKCKLAGETPPPDIIETGCPEWVLNAIPF